MFNWIQQMQRFIPSFIFLPFLLSSMLHAQPLATVRNATSHLTIGASLEGGLSHSFSVREKTSTESAETSSPIFAFRAGAAMSYPFTPTTSAMLTVGLDSRGGKFNVSDSINIFNNRGYQESHTTDRISYLSIVPGIDLSPLYIGVNIGIPLGGTKTSDGFENVPGLHIDTTVTSSADFDDHEKKLLNVMIEPRIGAIFPLVDNESGWLGLSIIAGYSLTKVNASEEVGGQTFEDPHQFATLQLGLTWQFAIPGTGRQ